MRARSSRCKHAGAGSITLVGNEVEMTRERDADEDVIEDDPTDPNHPDHDLSEAAPAYLDYIDKPWFLLRSLLMIITVLVIGGLVLPYLFRFYPSGPPY